MLNRKTSLLNLCIIIRRQHDRKFMTQKRVTDANGNPVVQVLLAETPVTPRQPSTSVENGMIGVFKEILGRQAPGVD